jgi:hypothetical protein
MALNQVTLIGGDPLSAGADWDQKWPLVFLTHQPIFIYLEAPIISQIIIILCKKKKKKS